MITVDTTITRLSDIELPKGIVKRLEITDENRKDLAAVLGDKLGMQFDPDTDDGADELDSIIVNFANANGMEVEMAVNTLIDGVSKGEFTRDDVNAYRDVQESQLVSLVFYDSEIVSITEAKDEVEEYAIDNGLSTYQAAQELINQAKETSDACLGCFY